ncbi:hypothetical protein VTN00DRAFT_4167 [Thermoascus crustaceus]|uniref:uncharacterized protein n=1 Tax=Thermoascus crustaceus TaxID=5088 RepID=UPI0037426A67
MANTNEQGRIDPSGAAGDPPSRTSTILETGASIVQRFEPTQQLCAHLNAFHVYAEDPTRCVEANHYCSHITEDLRQCLIYDTPNANARLIGVEYMISPRVYETLPKEERELWHSHQYEVKSGMLVMPAPPGTPTPVWSAAELTEMQQLIPLYGKTYHLWQIDRGDTVPIGQPQLMGSFTSDDTVRRAKRGGLDELLADRDARFGVNYKDKAERRKDIPPVNIHPDCDAILKKQVTTGDRLNEYT